MADDLTEILERLDLCRGDNEKLWRDSSSHLNNSVEFQWIPRRPYEYVLDIAPGYLAKPGRMRKVGWIFDVNVRMTSPIPLALRRNAGLIVNEIRTCLDSLAVKLAIRNGKSTNGVYFPISASAEVFKTDGIQKKINKLSETDREKIISLRPYKEGNPLLFLLHQTDIQRKHVALSPSFSLVGLLVNGISLPTGGTYQDCDVNGLHVPFMQIFDPDVSSAPLGEWAALARGVPDRGAQGRNTVAFADPPELRRAPACLFIGEWRDEVERIVRLFN